MFYLLSSPYLWFVSFLYLNLCVLGDDALVGKGSFVQTRYLYVLVCIWIGVGLALLNWFGPSGGVFY